MIILCLFLLFALFLFFVLKKPIYHPLVITSMIWLIIMILYNILDHGLYNLSVCFYNILGGYIISFFAGYTFITLLPRKIMTVDYDISILHFDAFPKLSKFLYDFSFIMLLIIFFRYLSILVSGENIYVLSVQNRLPTDIKVLNYFDKLILVYFFYLLLFKKLNKKDYLFLILYTFVTILKFGKLFILQLFTGSLIALWIRKKISIKTIFILMIVLIILLIGVHYARIENSSNSDITSALPEMLAIYVLSPSTAFDFLLNGKINPGDGHTFSFFYTVAERIFGIKTSVDNSHFDGWVYVPYPTNVYTIMFPFYADFKIIGLIIFSFIEGMLFSLLYSMRKTPFFLLIYVCISYALILQFFAEIFFSYFSTMIQIFFWSYVVIYGSNSRLKTYIFKVMHR